MQRNSMLPSLVICVCTRGRPAMLSRCLDALARQEADSDEFKIESVVIENEISPKVQSIVEKYSNYESEINFHYAHEPSIGISSARNRAIDESLKLGAEWIAFMDDDEYPTENWLSEIVELISRTGTGSDEGEVYVGPVVRDLDGVAPDWLQMRPPRHAEGAALDTCATNNVVFHRRLVAPDGVALRFKDAFGLSGGEDSDFFGRATQQGIKIRWSWKPVVHEMFHKNRLTMRHHIVGVFQTSNNNFWRLRQNFGFWRGFSRTVFSATLKLFMGLTVVVVLSPFFMFHPSIRRTVFKFMKRVAAGLGVAAAIASYRHQRYAEVDGE